MVTSGFHIKIWNQSFIASFVMFPSLQDLTGPLLRLSTCQGTGVALRVAEVLLQKQALPVVMGEGPWHLPLLQPGTACCCCCCRHRAGEGATSATDSLRLAWSCPSCGGRNSKSHTLRIVKALLPQPTPSFPHPLFIFCPSQTQAWSQLGPLALLQAHEELQKAVKRMVLSRAAPQGEGGFLQEQVKTLDSVGGKRDRGLLF